MYAGGIEVCASAAWMASDMTAWVCNDSFPPLRIAALPDFIAKLVMLTMTSGRASKMTKRTPIGPARFFSHLQATERSFRDEAAHR